jgi:drug/metabolite transporter (DMT)-like permease
MNWWTLSLASAVIWGFHYTMLEIAMKHISQTTAFILTCVPAFVIALVFHQQIFDDFRVFVDADVKIKVPIILIMFTGAMATMCLYFAMTLKSATHASLLEIAYPVFVTIFSLLILGVNHFSASTIIGALMILSGSAVVIINN